MSGICLTSGFDKALHVIATAELLRRQNVEVKGIFVVSPYSFRRLRSYVRQRGAKFIVNAAKRLTGLNGQQKNLVDEFLRENEIRETSLKKWATKHGVSYHSASTLNDAQTVDSLRLHDPDWVVYGGGGIVKQNFIDAVEGKILNSHAGPLPAVRGMNAFEWSILLDQAPHVTIHLINRGIDTGGIIKQIPIPIFQGDCVNIIRSRYTVIGVRELVNTVLNPPTTLPPANRPISRQCFMLTPAMHELLQLKLDQHQSKMKD